MYNAWHLLALLPSIVLIFVLSYLRLCSHLQVVTWNNVPEAQGRSSSCPHGVVFRKYVLPNGDTRKSHTATIRQVGYDKGY